MSKDTDKIVTFYPYELLSTLFLLLVVTVLAQSVQYVFGYTSFESFVMVFLFLILRLSVK